MKVCIDRKQFVAAISAAAAVAPKRTPKEVLKNVRLRADATFSLFATDTEQAIEVRLDNVDIQATGECLVNAERLAKIAKTLDGDEICIEATDRKVIVSGGGSKLDLPVNVDSLPSVVPFDSSVEVEVEATTLAEALKRCMFAVDTKETNASYALASIAFDVSEDATHVVSTDGKLLSYMQIGGGASDSRVSLVPYRSVASIRDAAIGASEAVTMRFGTSMIETIVGNTTVWVRLLDGRFVPWQKLHEQFAEPSGVLSIETGKLQKIFQRAAIVATETHPATTLDFSPNGLEISGGDSEVGGLFESREGEFEGDPTTFNAKVSFVVDAIKNLPADSHVRVKIREGSFGFQICGDSGFAAVIATMS